MTEPMSVLHLTGKDPSTGEIKTFDFEIVDEVARRQKADKADTVQETTLSRGRKEGTDVGEGSVAFGTDVEASGEGSHAEGKGTIANAPYMYVFGEYNTPAEVLPEWVAGTEYSTGDKVIYDGKAYVCDTANSDAEFDPAKWTEIDMPEAPVFVIGNGTSENSRGDAFAVERDGDVKAGGDLYTNYDPATGTGKKVATEDYVGDLIGDVVSMEYAVADELPATGEVGTIYLIPNGETSGTDTHDEYIWVPATESFEKIGNTKVDLSDYALKTDTVLNTTLSMGRKAGTTVGQNSVALGSNVTASGDYSHAEGFGSIASGPASHAEGYDTQATSHRTHAEGVGAIASGDNAHAEGGYTTASGINSHAEGGGTQATGERSHAEGVETLASGVNSHAEGCNTIANATSMHAQGMYNKSASLFPDWVSGTQYAVGDKVIYNGFAKKCRTANTDTTFTSSKWDGIPYNSDVAFVIGNGTADDARNNAFLVKWDGSVQEGYATTASGQGSHAEGGGTTASGPQSHAEGGGSTASDPQSHAEGAGTQASGAGAHAEGNGGARAIGTGSHAEGQGTTASGYQSHAEGSGSQATGNQSHAEGSGTKATGNNSHAEGAGSHAEADISHAEGAGTTASGSVAHAEGGNTTASGANSHAEGGMTIASGDYSHAEGGSTTASGDQSHAEGASTTASGMNSHAEGTGSKASGDDSHAEGENTIASGNDSHAEGEGTIANITAMHASGRYNLPDSDWAAGKSYAVGDRVVHNHSTYICKTANSDDTWKFINWNLLPPEEELLFVIGNGTGSNNRSNAFTVKWNGTTTAAGDVYANNTKKLATEEYVNNAIAGAGGGSDLTSIENRLDVLEGDEDTAGSVAEAKAVADQALEEAQACVYLDQGPANAGHHLWVSGTGEVTAEMPTWIMFMDSSRTKTFVITFGSNGELTVSEKESGHSVLTEVYNYKTADDELAARIKTLEDKVAALEGT